ncbi:oxidoreductase, short-chain dehydrogenase/reductase family protein [Roseivivax marinus]|uniref:Oxidoreductase, short-chain dehydrogenase/reductase family protein n=1 Tax=Roseivivax marinus TaxID=1379903 RepID=W4HFB5_9RHOB|nr:SDR family NAD(P)-dependent oxidoreductase [Roseivivax marinus]ETW11098.1 oxidoreductase, short-chain dehydrogenase/reductase family protein [Roseivivax marinus]UMA65440.1 SDR family NAD(P)-dependent oxidoreductase [Roseivivax marinus]SEL78916.1 NAD(P)-dependent dehydrogenase, short-chain alcohol dehydrogenase family [Roseivivax marinus]
MRTLVTGANRGIGAALCDTLKDRGHEVLPTARHYDGLVSLDVTDPGSQRDLARRLADETIDTLICNAGVFQDKNDKLEDGFSSETWAKTFEVNVTGVFLTIQSLLPMLRRAEDIGRIAIIGSDLGSSASANGGMYIYRASKAAVLNLGLNLAQDLKKDGIAVGVYHPGWVQTDMGGTGGKLTRSESATGLADRIEALDLDSTGCFEAWDGRAMTV